MLPKFIFDESGIYQVVAGEVDYLNPVMEKSERGWIQESVRQLCLRLKPKSVLEIGFGYGYTAEIFKKLVPEHVILERHPQIIETISGYNFKKIDAVDFKSEKHFDLIYSDPFPFLRQGTFKKLNYSYFAPAAILSKQGTGFWFDYGGKSYWQEVYENKNTS